MTPRAAPMSETGMPVRGTGRPIRRSSGVYCDAPPLLRETVVSLDATLSATLSVLGVLAVSLSLVANLGQEQPAWPPRTPRKEGIRQPLRPMFWLFARLALGMPWRLLSLVANLGQEQTARTPRTPWKEVGGNAASPAHALSLCAPGARHALAVSLSRWHRLLGKNKPPGRQRRHGRRWVGTPPLRPMFCLFARLALGMPCGGFSLSLAPSLRQEQTARTPRTPRKEVVRTPPLRPMLCLFARLALGMPWRFLSLVGTVSYARTNRQDAKDATEGGGENAASPAHALSLCAPGARLALAVSLSRWHRLFGNNQPPGRQGRHGRRWVRTPPLRPMLCLFARLALGMPWRFLSLVGTVSWARTATARTPRTPRKEVGENAASPAHALSLCAPGARHHLAGSLYRCHRLLVNNPNRQDAKDAMEGGGWERRLSGPCFVSLRAWRSACPGGFSLSLAPSLRQEPQPPGRQGRHGRKG